MKAYWWSGGADPRFLDLGNRCRWVVRFTPWLLYNHRKSHWYPLDKMLGGPWS